MSIFTKNKTGVMDVIRCDEPSYLIWKWHPIGTQLNDNSRENAIRWGSSLRVKDGEVAVFVFKNGNNDVQEFIEGPFDKAIETSNLPVIASIVGMVYAGESPFQAEVYFINLARLIQIKFGVPYFNVFDSEYPEFAIPVAVRGSLNFKISDYKGFVKLHRLISFTMGEFENSVRDVVTHNVKNVVLNIPRRSNVPVIQIENQIGEINSQVSAILIEELEKDFGIDVSRIDISAVEINRSSDGYEKLMSVTRDLTIRTKQAKTDADIINYAEGLRIQREEGQYAMHKQAQTSNFAAYQVEAQTQVGTAAAEALGKMGENGAGGINLGGNGAGFNPAAMMAGVAVGGAVGQNLAGMMGTTMQPGPVPPQIKQSVYHVAIDGQATGPFDIQTLKQMSVAGQINAETLVWKPGMPNWEQIQAINELKTLCDMTIPPIPKK